MPGREVIFPHGYEQIIKELAKNLDIRNDIKVTKIDYNTNPISVTTEDGKIYTANYVLSTLPLGVLKKGDVEFFPLLDTKEHAIKFLKMGTLNKVYYVFESFDDVFWDTEYDDEAGKPVNVQWIGPISEEGKGQWMFGNLNNTLGKPVLLAFTYGSYSVELEKTHPTDDEIADIGFEILKNIYETEDNTLDPPIYTYVTRWGTWPYSYGSYSYTGVGSTNWDYYQMSVPEKAKLFFAGETTSKEFPATVHGAYMSGIREAKRIESIINEIPPYAQIKNDLKPEYVVCKQDYQLMINAATNAAVCLKSESVGTLSERGFVKSVYDYLKPELLEWHE